MNEVYPDNEDSANAPARLPSRLRSFYRWLHRWHAQTGEIYATTAYLARKQGATERCVTDWIGKLKRAGYIKCERVGNERWITPLLPVPEALPLPKQKRQYRGAYKRPPVRGVVYLLEGGGFFKIGKSKNFRQRLHTLSIQTPFPISVRHLIATEDIDGVEEYWHKRLGHARVNGEWFTLTAEQVAEFCSQAEMSVPREVAE